MNNQLWKVPFTPPSASDMLSLPRGEAEKILDIPVEASQMQQEKGSAYYGYTANVSSRNNVRDLYQKIKLWHPEADHVMMAVKLGNDYYSCDDGEFNAGIKLQKGLEKRGTGKDQVVFVAREYGQVRLGPRRFHIMQTVATEALNKLDQKDLN